MQPWHCHCWPGSLRRWQHAARLLARCDAVLRIGGPSRGADALLELGRSLGLRIFNSLAEVPHLNIAT